MIQVKNNKIAQYFLPKTGTLASGEVVEDYHLLPREVLIEEGWLPVIERRPLHDEKTEMLVDTSFEILEDKVIKNFAIIKRREVVREEVATEEEEPTNDDEFKINEQILFETQYQTMLLEMGGGA